MVIRYRIHTEHVSPAMIARYFAGFTVIRAQGFYNGKSENAVIIEIIGMETDENKVLTLAREIRETYRQIEVWVTSEPVTLKRVTIDATTEGF